MMIDREPLDIDTKYQLNNTIFKRHWENDLYGGSILKPIVDYRNLTGGKVKRALLGNEIMANISEALEEKDQECKYYVI